MEKRLLVAEDDHELRKTLCLLLKANNYDVTAVEDGRQALMALQRDDFDAAIVDFRMPMYNAAEVLRQLRQSEHHHTPILVISAYLYMELYAELVRLGAVHVLPKPFDDQLLLSLLEDITESDAPPEHIFATHGGDCAPGLSDREVEVLLLMRYGASNDEIAVKLGVKRRTVDDHVKRVCEKLGVRNRTEAVAWSFRNRFID